MTRPLRVAIVGAGPAGIYAGNILNRQVTEAGGEVAIDLFESLPAPYGLIRYGVAPDHPRIKGIVNSLHEMLDAGTIRLIGNVEVRYDPEKRRVVYQPVTIEPRTLVPKVIREDNRYRPALKDAKPNG